VATVVLVAAVVLVVDGRDVRAASPSGQSVAVPAYFDPGPGWSALERADPPVTLVVMNPDNGPGAAAQADYLAAVRRAQAAGITVVGYVYTGYAHRPLAAVQADIDDYYRWYGVDGIFFDEASTDCADEPYYATLRAYVASEGGAAMTILNPGTATSQCYLAAADILLTFEGSYRQYRRDYSAPAWVAQYPPDRFWQIVYGAGSTVELRRALALSRERGVGYLYVTPERLPNPYGSLPARAYWHAELDGVRAG
jgi:hypothetical protein